MANANGADLTQFGLWYTTNCTPTARYETKYDEDAKTFYLTLSQESNSNEPLHIPVAVGLLDKSSGEKVVPPRYWTSRRGNRRSSSPDWKATSCRLSCAAFPPP